MTPFHSPRGSLVEQHAGGCKATLFNGCLPVLLFAPLLLFFSFSLTQAAEKNVLFVHTAKSNAAGAIMFDKIFEATLTAGSSDRISLYNEYSDLWRFSNDEYQRALRDFYRQKYAGQRLDLVVVDSPPALKFLLAYGDELFPGTPVIFCVTEGGISRGCA